MINDIISKNVLYRPISTKAKTNSFKTLNNINKNKENISYLLYSNFQKIKKKSFYKKLDKFNNTTNSKNFRTTHENNNINCIKNYSNKNDKLENANNSKTNKPNLIKVRTLNKQKFEQISLETISPPHTQNLIKIKKKTLVLDLDDTLIHSFLEPILNSDFQLNIDIYDNIKDREINKIYIKKRPGLDIFLNELSKYYKIYIFSASPGDYVSRVIKEIDKNKIIKKYFYKDDCITMPEVGFDIYLKDLTIISNDLSNIIILDDNITSFSLQSENGIGIKPWYGDMSDRELFKLIPILKKLVLYKDVRIEIKKLVVNNIISWNKCIQWLKSGNEEKVINNPNKDSKLKILKNKSTLIHKPRYESNSTRFFGKTMTSTINNNNDLLYKSTTHKNKLLFKSNDYLQFKNQSKFI